ncbi:MAG: 3-hydroxymyristoyl/3-hydroxydecanoyl-(acyl carrier protein) dehydratase, partial [Myxococcota bacterium]
DSVASVTAPAPSHTESTAIDPTGVHAADGLLAVARAAEMIATSGDRTLRVNALGGQDATVHVRGGSGSLPAFTPWVRSLDLPVRWAAPEFPAVAQARPIDAKPALPPTAATPFPSAPPLPKILDWPINSNSNSSQEPVIMDHTPSVISPSVAEAPQPPPRITTAATAVPTNTQIPGDASYLFNAHRQFVEQQTLVHRAFLDMRARMQAAFIGNPGVTPDAPTLEAATAIQRQPTPQAAKPVVLAPVAIATPAAKRAPEPKAKPQLAAPKQVLPTGLTLNREQLKTHASGAISEIYGPLFAQQDGYERQVRMPEPPLLLADRMTGLDAEAGSMAKGTIWTETDVSASSWYLHDGRMPAGIMIESGQADLMLISYLGIDFVNRSERVYRLLGCELTYHAAEKTGPHGAVLPATGETLRYDIHVDGHANQGDIRLFFFHYDCRIAPTGSSPSQFSDADIRLSVREGQAGFFTEAELAESMGILWSAEDDDRALPAAKAPRFDAPVTISTRTTFNRKQLEAFASGDAYTCFGDGFELSASHTRTPRISGGRMLFLDAVTHFEPKGGPWGRGYLRAVDTINSDDWFFDGHFKNDSCMPGTLMFEGCLQTMAFYLAGLGYTLDADGWRFEPVPEVPYQLLCRGEVDRQSKELVYEIFVDEIHDGPYPTLFADILCTVDGLKAFHCRRMGLRLVPGWPMDSRPELLAEHIETKPVAQSNGFPFDYASLMSCAWGRPSDAFGPMYQIFDDTRRVARLPGPPYHFMSRVTSVDGEIGQFKSGLTIEIEYDIPEDAWYFRENGTASMPFAVLLEAALQPCGWLASAVGSATTVENDLFFRNLDGKGTVLVELLPTSGTLTTRTKITSISSSAGMIIESFDVLCFIGETAVYELKTVFGFFPAAALASQVGLPISDDQRGFIEGPSERSVDLTARDPQWFDGSLCLASPFLLMVDRVTGIWPDAGAAGLGRYRGEKRVDPQEWFFKAHFYQDPVQPGSLGIEAMIQLLQFAMLDRNMGDGIDEPRFEALMTGHEMSWKYRGQVRIHNQLIGSTIEITEVGTDENGPYAIANGSLWCDGLRIYEATGLGMRIVSGAIDTSHLDDIIDIDTAPWLTDHRPTWTVPSVPMMGIVNRLAQAASGEGRVVVGLSSVSIKRWCRLAPSITLKHEIRSDGRTANVRLLDEGGEIASGTVHLRNQYTQGPAPLPTLDAPLVDSPYETGALFHGPAFQRLITLRRNSEGASSMLSATAGEHGPLGILNTILLDAATHGILHDDLNQWNPAIGTDMVAYPALVPEITIHGPTPTSGEVRCEVRTSGFFGSDQFPSFRLQLIVGESVWLTAHLVEALFPKGPLGSAAPLDRRAFLRDRRYVPSVALSQSESGQTVLNHDDVVNSDWLEGTVQAIYGTSDPETIAIREHLARNIGVHPSAAEAATPLNQWPLETVSQAKTTTVRSVGEPSLNIEPIREFWRNWFDRGPWPVEDLYYGLVKRFVRRVVLDDAAALATTRGRGVIYLANHQTMIESLLMSIVASAIGGAPTRTLAKDAHRDTWLGRLIEHCFSYPGVDDPGVITFVDRTDGAAQLEALSKLAADLDCGRSLLVHVEGTRALSPSPVTTVSGSFIDMALAANAAIIPIKFVGGLPITPGSERLEFPVGMGSQDIWFGAPLTSETLAALPYGERRSRVMDAINALGPAASAEQPNPGNPEFAARVDAHQQRYGVDEAHAVMAQVLVDEGLAAVAPEAPLPTDSTGPWIAELRRRLYGEPSP